MNRSMWENAATRNNRRLLATRGIQLWGPASGEQACGETGPGRMLEAGELIAEVNRFFCRQSDASGIKVLITAGPTREPIDPVRFVGNRSSGKMGFALAQAFHSHGAEVTLVAGPVALETPTGIRRHDVETAQQMHSAVMAEVTECDIFIACAAVSDYRPLQPETQKIKKTRENLVLDLVPNPDILAEVAALPRRPFTVGFAAETERPAEQAEHKRQTKGADMIAANLVGAETGGFERDENAVCLLWDDGREDLPLMPKSELALALTKRILKQYEQRD
jgi:phosphopantothenoylcysteine decarboxylase/phosphopantothenate--cysteine ligase